MKKTRIPIITIAVLLAVIVAPIAANLWAKHHAAQYLEEKYGDAIVVEDVSFHHVRVNPFRGEYTARADYADIEFLISRGSDTYTEAYHMRRYADLLLSNGMDEWIGIDSIVMLDRPSGASVLDNTDVPFHLSLHFNEPFLSKEAFADGVEMVLSQLDAAGLSCCDTLMTYGHVGERRMSCSISPMTAPAKAEILAAIDSP